MHKNNNSKAQGFTLIEVVLVLAIAGLIFLIVFLALPALQRSQRDTQRRNDIARMISQLTQYQSNKQGAVPGTQAEWDAFKTSYLTNGGQSFNDPTNSTTYGITLQSGIANATAPSIGNIYVYSNAKCDPVASTGLAAGSGSRSIAAVIGLEQGGSFCQNN
jgi:prepilin-type N-terminal cleavage/methylation domain-containing protein